MDGDQVARAMRADPALAGVTLIAPGASDPTT
jgi:hypothetical protein